MPDSAPELVLLLTNDGRPPHTLRPLPGGEALTRLLKSILKREDIDTAYSDEGDHPTFARRLLEMDCGCAPVSLEIGVSTPIFGQPGSL